MFGLIAEDTEEPKRRSHKKKIQIKKHKDSCVIFSSKGEVINMDLKGVYLPHGIEKYNGKHILNIYADKNSDNDEHNKLVEIINTCSQVERLQDNEFDAKRYNIKGKGYISPLTEQEEYGKDTLAIRTYMNYNAKVSLPGAFGYLDFDTDITRYRADVNVTVKSIWTTDNNYGLIIYTNSINLLNRVKKSD